MKELTEHEKAIRDKNTKDLTLSELKEKMRVIDKEIHAFDTEIFELVKLTYQVYRQRDRRIKYNATLKADYNRRVISLFNKEL